MIEPSHQHEQQHHQHEQFESMSSHTDDPLQNQQNLPKRDYATRPIQFPQPQIHTLKLLQIYEQNTKLINDLKQQIHYLQMLKKQNLYIKYDSPKVNFQQQQSQFFLRSQQVYQQRQEEMEKLRQQIKSVDNQQMKTLMSKNPNIYLLTERYFKTFKKIIDAKIYDKLLITLTEEIKVKIKKRKHSQLDVKGTGHQQSPDNLSPEPIIPNNLQQVKSTQSDKHSTVTTSKYMIRLLPLQYIFSELSTKSTISNQCHYVISLPPNHIPLSCSYNLDMKLVLILLADNTLSVFKLPGQDQQVKKDDRSCSSQKSQPHKHKVQDKKLIEVANSKVQFDRDGKIIFFQMKNNNLVVGTSEGIVRVFNIVVDQNQLFVKFSLQNILTCFNFEFELGDIKRMCFSNIKQDQLIFYTSQNLLCKINFTKFKTQMLYKFSQKIIDINLNYIETQNYIYLNYLNQNEQKVDKNPIDKSKVKTFQNSNNMDTQIFLKVDCFEDSKTFFFVKISTHGQLTGFKEEF